MSCGERCATPADRPTPAKMGFTLIELLVVVVIVSILAAIALPNYQAVMLRARAADVIGRIEVIEHAVVSYSGELHNYPPDAAVGQTPVGLEPFLPDGFVFGGEGYDLDWENYAVGDGNIVGVAVTPDQEVLGNALLALTGSAGWLVLGNTFTKILEGG